MISPDGIAGRLDRIQKLVRGLCQEVQRFRCPADMLSPREQKAYLAVLTDGVVRSGEGGPGQGAAAAEMGGGRVGAQRGSGCRQGFWRLKVIIPNVFESKAVGRSPSGPLGEIASRRVSPSIR
jgi:hypothetical protein